ncbi:MAG: 4-hydroxythreonine-4-phosphate dehydrogenase PdxA [Pigmentiphaga sp.]|uniref:PdxA family dehydrogenase n=1 Tax=Pigmentiphaga sp. TaxID=1977564 RepID=UPI0029AABF94|nr:4-hydroxythreonine-4-phosphate dehydrogenase PdxA [Pigmentiphaga sp.]MDX3906504.1 4-hydroxythreonine-4-phosphate dehydrogenase PdxA [Pigmentiphaga sp.]
MPDHAAGPRPVIAVMMGDPAGIGPEVVIKALSSGAPQAYADYFMVGSAAMAERVAQLIASPLKVRAIGHPGEARGNAGTLAVLDPDPAALRGLPFGQPNAQAGRAVRHWMDICERLVSEGAVQGWVMAPIDRTSLKMGTGLAESGEAVLEDVPLLRISGSLRIVPLSEHIPLREVAATVTPERVSAMIGLVHDTLAGWGVEAPRIALAGLNPHARGQEETAVLAPAVAQARARGIDASGPVSPDAVFRQCLDGRYDIVISMYHDQGQIALKTAAFEGACSVHLGLPYVHVTVPHGSAFDIAGRGIADARSMSAALLAAGQLASGRYAMRPSTTEHSRS